MGYTLMFAGVLLLISAWSEPVAIFVSTLVILLGGYLSFTKHGVELDPEQRKYRVYKEFLGSQWGAWHSFESFPDISVLRKNMVEKGFSRGQVELNMRDLVYDITLLSKTHREKLVIRRVSDQDLASSDAKELAEVLGVRYCKYAPKISERTRARR